MSCSNGKLPALTALHHAAVCQQRLIGLLEGVVCPVLQMLTNTQLQTNVQASNSYFGIIACFPDILLLLLNIASLNQQHFAYICKSY